MAYQIDAYKKMLSEFIELYRNMPFLWKVSSKEYNDRNKKDRGYDVLANKLKEVDPTANRDKVVKKINNMRTSFRKELKKYLKSKETETNPEDVYRPKLWYFDALLFLVETEEESEECDNGQKTAACFLNEQDCGQELAETMPEQHMQDASSSIELKYSDIVKEEMLSIMSEQHMQDASSSVELKYSDIVKEEMLSDETDSQQVDEVQENNIQDQEKHPEYETITKKRSVSLIEEDECDLIGKCVAAKLRRLDPIDALIAEKRINDILFDFQLKSLSRSGSQLRIPDDL
ncbi:uncharacterized protein LOC126743057 isoform X4 [Anthonomus grandis grandis]|uniref:uncharacterized protein LOC126743057 isoform X4 n=1 Tax=Anthonomus grandis grandis TaxID=2921223 RepID=UPI002165D249|nr:uncharacterized protein LOC126743057 isoform X4 [Anthonomus grandis grandis]